MLNKLLFPYYWLNTNKQQPPHKNILKSCCCTRIPECIPCGPLRFQKGLKTSINMSNNTFTMSHMMQYLIPFNCIGSYSNNNNNSKVIRI